jgi:glycosyltransferase involved in cell wall biosynthesis
MGDKARLLILTGGLGVGGTERHLSLVLPELAARGWPIEVALLAESGSMAEPLRSAGIRLHAVPERILVNLPKIRAVSALGSQIGGVIALLRRLRPDILHCFLPHPCIVGAAAALGGPAGTLVMSKRSQMIRPAAFPGDKKLERWALRRAARVLAHSNVVAEELAEAGVERSRIVLVHNGIDLAAWMAGAVERDRTRSREGWGADEVVILATANLIPYKGHETLLRAAGHLRRRGLAAWRLALVGGGADDYRARLGRLAEEEGIAGRVVFLGPRRDIPFLASAADIGALASAHEGFANALIEYMAAGLPAVATNVGGNRDAVIDGVTGALVPAGAPEPLAAALARLIGDPALRRAQGQAGQQRAAAEFSLAACVDGYERVYRSLASG